MTTNLILVGPMGSGKSTVGAALARELNRPHVDTDQFFCARYGAIPKFFAEHGEQAFRRAEERIIAELLDSPRPSVVSLGGGSVNSEATRDLLRSHFVVMLDMTREQASQRIPDASSRPMLLPPARLAYAGQNLSPQLRDDAHPDPELTDAQAHHYALDQWQRIYRQREPLYRECADLVVSADTATIADRIEHISAALKKGKQQK